MMERKISVLPDANAVAAEAAKRWQALAGEAIAARGRFSVALSGGTTPRVLFALLASDAYRNKVAWDKTIIFWSDERCVPPEHPDSNYRLARETLLSKVPAPAGNVHRLRGEVEPEQAALEYEQTIRREVKAPVEASLPAFDLIFLGLGTDGHTASLFPGTAALHEKTRLVAANAVPQLNARRLTLTPPLINAAAQVMFLVTGNDKADALRAVLEGESKPDVWPAQIVKPAKGQVTWLVDRAAGAQLRQR